MPCWNLVCFFPCFLKFHPLCDQTRGSHVIFLDFTNNFDVNEQLFKFFFGSAQKLLVGVEWIIFFNFFFHMMFEGCSFDVEWTTFFKKICLFVCIVGSTNFDVQMLFIQHKVGMFFLVFLCNGINLWCLKVHLTLNEQILFIYSCGGINLWCLILLIWHHVANVFCFSSSGINLCCQKVVHLALNDQLFSKYFMELPFGAKWWLI
jgi:hypothetical protein